MIPDSNTDRFFITEKSLRGLFVGRLRLVFNSDLSFPGTQELLRMAVNTFMVEWESNTVSL